MSWDINSVTMIGRLTKDIELKYTTGGAAVAKFTIAVGGKPMEGKENTFYFNVVVWGKQAENASSFLSKGSQVCIDGRLEQRTWTTDDGSKRNTVEIVAERVEYLNTKKKDDGYRGQKSPGNAPGKSDTGFDDNGYDPDSRF